MAQTLTIAKQCLDFNTKEKLMRQSDYLLYICILIKIVDQSLFERNSLPHNTEQTTLPIFKYLYEHSVFYHSNFCVVLLFRNILRFYGTLFCFRVNINVIFNNIPFL